MELREYRRDFWFKVGTESCIIAAILILFGIELPMITTIPIKEIIIPNSPLALHEIIFLFVSIILIVLACFFYFLYKREINKTIIKRGNREIEGNKQ